MAAPTIDYEAEYDNRARVPEHPDIFARWERETADYRAAAKGIELGIPYGPAPRQKLDFYPAQASSGGTAPLALFIHGGWWRSLDPKMFGQQAKGPNAHGIDVVLAGYELCPNVSIANIIEQMRAACIALWKRYHRRIFVYGHSAGGHLTACMVATDWSTLASDVPADLVPSGYAVSGVFDLAPMLHVSQNEDLRLDERSAYADAPLHWNVPAGRKLDAMVGSFESGEFLRQSRAVAGAWRTRGIETRYGTIDGANHFTVVDPLADPRSAMTARVVEMARAAAALPL